MSTDLKQAISFGELWGIQESLLQAYRTIFITVESVIFAVAVFLLSIKQASHFFSIPIQLLGLLIIPIWMGVCRARARAISFIHWLIQKYETGEDIAQPYSAFRQFQENRKFNNINVLSDENYKKLNNSKTRIRMDIQLPMLFVFLWIFLIMMQFFI